MSNHGNTPAPVITIATPLPSFKKMRIADMPPGTVFVNAYHSPQTILGGGDKFSIYMKLKANNEGFQQCLRQDSWTTPLVVNLRNGNAYNLDKKQHKPTEGYILSAEITVRLLG